MDDRLEVGAMALSIHLIYRMREHMNTQFPKAIAKLKASLVDTNERLESIRERDLLLKFCVRWCKLSVKTSAMKRTN